jgi:hypothetical protein
MSYHSAVAAIFFAVVACLPSSHSLTPQKCVSLVPPVIQHVEKSPVELGPARTLVTQHASVESSPCHSRRKLH